MSNVNGTLVWVTGIANSGKTTVSSILVDILRSKGCNVIHLDGDDLRGVLSSTDQGFTRADRSTLALIYFRLCNLLVRQGFDIVLSSISLYSEVHQYNATTFKKLFHVYLDVDEDVAHQRDLVKGVYRNQQNTGKNNLVGYGIKPDHPEKYDLVMSNNGDQTPLQLAMLIYNKLLSPNEGRRLFDISS